MVAKRYFGTDGIRGKAGEDKLSAGSIERLARAVGQSVGGKVVIGRDTRLSGDMVEAALVAGFTSQGVKVEKLGILPTAATSFLAAQSGADMGVMVTASHNKFADNGIKFFMGDGRKLSDDKELEIEALLAAEPAPDKTGGSLGHVGLLTDHSAYYDRLMAALPKIDFSHARVVVDCANGAAFETAPRLLEMAGFKHVTIIGDKPSGTNINADCGSTHPQGLSAKVLEVKADFGIALDGDADRLVMCDDKGQTIDGDQLLGLIGSSWQDEGRLAKPAIVATVMSNLGLERYLDGRGLKLIRTAVGDRHVAAVMQAQGYNVGGEQSGHILLPDYLPTGDGMLAALQVLSACIHAGRPSSEVLNVFEPVPQLLVNVRYEGTSPLELKAVKAAIKEAESDLSGEGRLLIRASGTEPVIRVMAEGDDPARVDAVVHQLADFIREATS